MINSNIGTQVTLNVKAEKIKEARHIKGFV